MSILEAGRRFGPSALAWLLFAALTHHAFHRPWSQDESRYILAAKYVSEGLAPYRDFAYFQMPLHPWMLSAWQFLVGDGLIAGRLLSILALGLLCVGLWMTGRAGRWGVLLMLSNPLVWDYFVLIKPFAVSASLAAGGLLLYMRKPLVAGVLIGSAALTRLLLGGPFLAGAADLFRPGDSRRMRALARFVLGGALCSAGVGLAYLQSGSSFLLSAFQPPAVAGFYGKAATAGPVVRLILSTLRDPAHLALFISFVLAVILSAVEAFQSRRLSRLWIWPFAALLVLAPTLTLRPFYDENFSSAVPFVAIFLGLAVERFRDRLAWRRLLTVALAGCLIIGSYSALGIAYRELVRPETFRRLTNSPDSVRRVGERIAALVGPRDLVLATWSGYPLAAERRLPVEMIVGLSGLRFTARMSQAKASAYRLPTPAGVVRMVRSGEAKLVVVGLGSEPGFEDLVAESYLLVEVIAGARLYIRPNDP